MKTWEKQLLIGLALVGIIFAFGIVLYMFTSGHPVGGPGVSGYQEKLTIQSASFNSMQNAITLQVQSIKNNVTFNGAIIKDTEGAVIYISELSCNVP